VFDTSFICDLVNVDMSSVSCFSAFVFYVSQFWTALVHWRTKGGGLGVSAAIVFSDLLSKSPLTIFIPQSLATQ